MEKFDACSFRGNQLMYLPTTPKDGEFIFETTEGDWLNPDDLLAAHPDWRDCSTLPVSDREKNARSANGKKQQDPLGKPGVVGAFCRTYSVSDAIETFLSDIYEPFTSDGRYTYIPGESAGGLVVYEDKFAYSHHATDPACGTLCNAFDLVRLHKFGDGDDAFQKMSAFAESDPKVKKMLLSEKTAQAKKDFEEITSSWEQPIPIGRYTLLPFPVDALPDAVREYVISLSESLQTPVDMAGCAALAVIATAMQGKYAVQDKPDWTEPVNAYFLEIAPPSERKSAVQSAMTQPLSDYENEYNRVHAAEVAENRLERQMLTRQQKIIEEQAAKSKATKDEIRQVAQRIADFREKRPLRLFADDITPEKLASMLSANNGRMALLSSESGIFDTLSGAYAKSVNIDVMLKSYSGDEIRVDRIGRESECIHHPALTILLMAQPSITSKVLSNETFRGRGLTARFLYSMPVSAVGGRKYRSHPVSEKAYGAYARCVTNLLEDGYPGTPEIIGLSEEADRMLGDFADALEPKLITDYAEMADWCGKLVGNILRISGLLCRAGTYRDHDFMKEDTAQLTVDEKTMANAIQLGRYFLNHAQSVFDVIPEDAMYHNAKYVLDMIAEKKPKRFSRRDVMRFCRAFHNADETQPVLDFLEEYGYIAQVPTDNNMVKGRPPMPRYMVNPWFLKD